MGKRRELVCGICSCEYTATSAKMNLCSPECRRVWNSKNDPEESPRPRTCTECGNRFSANKNGKTCSASCQDILGARLKRQAHERNRQIDNLRSREHSRKVRNGYVPPLSRPKPKQQRECVLCHSTFTSGALAQFCSDRCRGLHKSGPRLVVPCVACGSAHIKWRGSNVCSSECRKARNADTKSGTASGSAEYKREYGIQYRKANADRLKEQKRQYDLAHPDRKRDGRRRSKGYRQSAPKGEPYTQAMLVSRDGDDCYLCGRVMDFSKGTKGSPWTVSIDHVLPLSLGGVDGLENVRLAHVRCNISKHNRTLGELEDRGLLPMLGPSPLEVGIIEERNNSLHQAVVEYAS